VPPRRDPLLVLGIVGQYPMAGVAWQAIHYLLGLRRLGWDVYYVEDSGAAPYDPRHGGRTDDPAYSVGYVADVMRRFGFEDRWVYLDMARDETYGLSRGRLGELYRQAAGILNLCGATAPRAEHRQGARLVYVETDPVYEQLRIALGEESSLGFLASHDVLFTYGENLGAADCPVPLERFTWHPTRPPVVLEEWAARPILARRSSRPSRPGRTRARTSAFGARRTSGRSTSTSSASSTCRGTRSVASSWRWTRSIPR